jgi:hypothetical protein
VLVMPPFENYADVDLCVERGIGGTGPPN